MITPVQKIICVRTGFQGPAGPGFPQYEVQGFCDGDVLPPDGQGRLVYFGWRLIRHNSLLNIVSAELQVVSDAGVTVALVANPNASNSSVIATVTIPAGQRVADAVSSPDPVIAANTWVAWYTMTGGSNDAPGTHLTTTAYLTMR